MNQHGGVILIEEVEHQINLPKVIRITGVIEYINYYLNLCLICDNNCRLLINIEIVDLHVHFLGNTVTIIGELKVENSQLLLYNYRQLLSQSSFPSFSNESSTDNPPPTSDNDSQFILNYIISHSPTIKLLYAQIVVNTTQIVNMDTYHTVIKKRREFLTQQEQLFLQLINNNDNAENNGT